MTDSSTQVNTAGGSAIEGDVKVDQGDFVGRDKIEQHYHYAAGIQPPTATPATPRGIFGLYPFNEHFFGRDEELATLHRLLQTESNVSICPVITGMGGLGKTQLAAHYARAHIADYPDGIFWVTAANLNEIRPQLADFCVALGLPVADPQRSSDLTEQKISAFKGYLDQHLRALLIFDNVEEPDHLRTHQIGIQLTALMLGGKVIVTTRRRKVANDKFAELALQRLLPAPARQILTTARPDLAADPDLDRLCEQFGYLPLMLNLATAALKKRGGTIAGYLQRLHTLGAEQLHGTVAKVNLDDYHKSLTVVLQEQWSMLQDDNARLLLRVAGQLPEATLIPTARLGLLAGLVDVDEWERPLRDALDELDHTSLIEGVDQETLRLHPLVHHFAAAKTAATDRTAFCTACAQRLATAYSDLHRLGQEYAERGIAALLVDLMSAIEIGQPTAAMPQSPVPTLQYFLHLLRRSSNHLHDNAAYRQPHRIWQQLLLHTAPSTNSNLHLHLNMMLRSILHWLPLWGNDRHSSAVEQTFTGHKNAVLSVAVVDKYRIISASADRTLKVWNIATGQVEQTLTGHIGWVRNVAVVDSHHIVSASSDHTLKIWNISTGQVEQTLTGHAGSVRSVAVVDSQRIVSTSSDHTLKIWNITTGQVEQTLYGHESWVSAVVVLDATRIVSASDDRTLKIWNLITGQVEQTLSDHESWIHAMTRLDSTRIVSTYNNGVLKVWNLATEQVEQTLRSHAGAVWNVAILDTTRIISAADDWTLKIWNLATGQNKQTQRSHVGGVWGVKIVGNQRIVSVANDDNLKVWNLHTGEVEQTLCSHESRVSAIAVLDTIRIVFAVDDNLKVWNLHTGEVEQTLCSHESRVNAIAVLNATHIVSASDDRTLKIWNLATGQVDQTLGSHAGIVGNVTVIDATRIVFATNDRMLKIWNLATGQVKQTQRVHKGITRSVTVLDSNCIVTAANDNILKVWNLHTGQIEQTLIGHNGWICDVAVVDRRRIVSASADRTLKVWDLTTGQVIASIGLEGAPQCVAVTQQDGRTLVVAGDAGGALYCLELVEPVAEK